MDEPASVRALRMPEILDNIFVYLAGRPRGKLAQVDTDVLIRPALVNRVWSERALEEIWSQCPRFDTLVQLPKHRQQYYSSRIRSLRLYPSWPGDPALDPDVRFPLLRQLELISGPLDWDSDRPRVFRLFNRNPIDLVRAATTSTSETDPLLTIAETFPNLESLSVEDASRCPDIDVLASAIRLWSRLTSLRITFDRWKRPKLSVPRQLLLEIANAPQLEDLNMREAELHDDAFPVTMQPGKAPFSALQSACFNCSMEAAPKLTWLLSSGPLKELDLHILDGTGHPDFFPHLSRLSNLTFLNIAFPPDFHFIPATDLLSLRSLTTLLHLCLTSLLNMPHSGLDDKSFDALFLALQQLRSLDLGILSDITAASVLSCGRRCRDLVSLSLVGKLDLSTITGKEGDVFPELTKLHIYPMWEPNDQGDRTGPEDFKPLIDGLLDCAPKLGCLLLGDDRNFMSRVSSYIAERCARGELAREDSLPSNLLDDADDGDDTE